MGIGALCAFVALVLLRLIGLFTNLFYFGRWNTAMVSPAGNHLGVYSVLVPIAGALVIGVMAWRRCGRFFPGRAAPLAARAGRTDPSARNSSPRWRRREADSKPSAIEALRDKSRFCSWLGLLWSWSSVMVSSKQTSAVSVISREQERKNKSSA